MSDTFDKEVRGRKTGGGGAGRDTGARDGWDDAPVKGGDSRGATLRHLLKGYIRTNSPSLMDHNRI